MWRSPFGLIVTLTLGILVAPLPSIAQPPGKVVRIGWLSFGFASSPALDGLRQGLRELGYVEGQNLALERRHAEGHYERLPDLAADLVRLRVEVSWPQAPPRYSRPERATSTVPIVMVGAGGSSASGVIASLVEEAHVHGAGVAAAIPQ